MTQSALEAIKSWTIPLVFLLILVVAFLGPRGAMEVWDAMSEKLKWENLNPFNRPTPENPDPFRDAVRDKNKLKQTEFNLAELNTLLDTSECLSAYIEDGTRFYLMRSRIGRPIYYLFIPEKQAMGTLTITSDEPVSIGTAFRNTVVSGSAVAMRLKEESLGTLNTVGGLYANCRSGFARDICKKIMFSRLEEAVEKC